LSQQSLFIAHAGITNYHIAHLLVRLVRPIVAFIGRGSTNRSVLYL